MKKHAKISNNYISVLYKGIPSYGGSQLWFDKDMHKCGCGVIAAADVLMYLRRRKSAEPVQDGSADKVHNKLMNSLGKLCKAPAFCRRYIKLDKHDTSETADKLRRSDAVPSAKEKMPEKSCGNVITFDAYIRYVEKLRPAFPLIPGRGMPCFMLVLYMKIYMLITRMPYRVHFGTGIRCRADLSTTGLVPVASDNLSTQQNKCNKSTTVKQSNYIGYFLNNVRNHSLSKVNGCDRSITSCICDMLAHDIPVILCIGPGVHQFMKAKAERGVMLYSRSETVRCASGSGNISADDIPADNVTADIMSSVSAANVADNASADSVSPDETSVEVCQTDTSCQCMSAYAAEQTVEYNYTPVKRIRSHFVVITEIDGDYAKVSSWGKFYYISVAELTHYLKCDMFGLFTNIVRISVK